MTTVDELEAESLQTLNLVKHRQNRQRLFNIVTLLAIAALFYIAINNKIAIDKVQRDALDRVCSVTNISLLKPNDQRICIEAKYDHSDG